METREDRIQKEEPLFYHPIKPKLMSSRQILNRSIIIGFMVLIGFALAKAIYHGSFMGIVLALVSLGAAVYFLYVAAKARQEMEIEMEEDRI